MRLNELSWIVNPTAPLCDNGRVQLSESKTAKIIQICQDIQALLPNAQPSLDQVLLSLTMHRKTGSSSVINTLHRMGYGISYTDTIFIEDKWAEWSEKQHSYIPTNIKEGVHCTHVADNIDWRNKDMAGNRETHNTNSILIQHKDTLVSDDTRVEHKAQVSVVPDYDFDRSDHSAFTATRTVLPHYIPAKPCSVNLNYKYDDEDPDGHQECSQSKLETLAWVQCRRVKDDNGKPIVPAWSAFKQLVTSESPAGVNVGYLPAITAPPTNMNVILAILNRTLDCMTELKLETIFLECDQAIYTKVLQVLFKFKQEGSNHFDNIVVRMGGFHIVMCLMKAIYSRFQGSGIVELLAESGVGTEGAIKSGMNGTYVKQGLRYYKLLFESLLRTKVAYIEDVSARAPQSATETYVGTNHTTLGMESGNKTDSLPEMSTVDDISMLLSELSHNPSPESLEKVVCHPQMKLPPKLPGGMAQWLDSLIEMVDLLLNIIHFQRIGNWDGYLEAIYEFLPWCFGLNRQNYSRNLSYFYMDMKDLKERNPAAYQYMSEGGFQWINQWRETHENSHGPDN